MRFECMSADAAATRVCDPDAGTGWRFGPIERDGRRDLAPSVRAEHAVGETPASFIAVAGAWKFAFPEARMREPIDR